MATRASLKAAAAKTKALRSGSSSTSSKPSNIESRTVELPSGETLTGDATMNYGKGAIAQQTADIQSSIAPTQPIQPTQQPAQQPVAPQTLGPNDQVPQSMVDQFNQIKAGVSTLSDQYKSAANLAKQSGVAPAQDSAGGMVGAQQFLGGVQGPQEEGPSLLGGVMETDSNFDSILTMYDDFMSPVKQRQTLLQEYQALSNSLGIQQMNEELIDAKRIIEGTTEDIQAEITSSGGLATDSLVMALSNARNKSLIRNYNYLLESRDSAMTQLNTMMNLSIQDRQMAEAEFDRKLGFAMKVAEFKERATTNARNTYMTLGDKMGWDTLLSQASPYEQGVIGKTLGLNASGLQQLALRSQQDRQMQMLKQNLEIRSLESGLLTDEAQRANIWSQIAERNKDIPGTTEYEAAQSETALQDLSSATWLKSVIDDAKNLSDASGQSKAKRFFGKAILLGGPTKYDKLKNLNQTIKTNILTQMSTADIKKFFGPQMSEADVENMLSSGSTLNPEVQSPEEYRAALKPFEDLINSKLSVPIEITDY